MKPLVIRTISFNWRSATTFLAAMPTCWKSSSKVIKRPCETAGGRDCCFRVLLCPRCHFGFCGRNRRHSIIVSIIMILAIIAKRFISNFFCVAIIKESLWIEILNRRLYINLFIHWCIKLAHHRVVQMINMGNIFKL